MKTELAWTIHFYFFYLKFNGLLGGICPAFVCSFSRMLGTDRSPYNAVVTDIRQFPSGMKGILIQPIPSWVEWRWCSLCHFLAMRWHWMQHLKTNWTSLKILLGNAAPYSFDDAFTRYLHALDGITVTQSEMLFNTFKFLFIARVKWWFLTLTYNKQ